MFIVESTKFNHPRTVNEMKSCTENGGPALIVKQPNQCPFRKDNVCYLVDKKHQVLKSCNIDFVKPVDCPLEFASVFVTTDV